MRESFHAAGYEVLGSAVAVLPLRATCEFKVNLTYFYFCSDSIMAREFKKSGILRYVFDQDGRRLQYTHKNHHGRKPTEDSDLVLMGFGRDPMEKEIAFDRGAHAAYRRRQKMSRPPGIVRQANASAPATSRKVAATTKSAARGGTATATRSVRPAQQAKPKNNGKNLG